MTRGQVMERLGVILVHGIGEQKRFAHLDSELRGLIEGFKRRPGARVTVEILSGSAVTYNAEQDTWAGGSDPSARVTVVEPDRAVEINVHEVWWADVNEPYSLAKQVRFWLWGLSMWSFPRSPGRDDLPGYREAMLTPQTPEQTAFDRGFVRAQLFMAGTFFLVAAFSLGAAVFFAKRLFGLEPPDFVRVFVNYISGVKLYNQSTRQGSGFLPNRHGFLDTLDDPPRFSIRRRMIQAVVAVGARPPGKAYDRWYVLGHSLGSIVSFNGVMEPGQSFANYLTRDSWDELKANGFAGPARPAPHDPPDWVKVPPGTMSPTRPVWLADNELVYRDKIFANFRGLLTYGSPLGKFAELWPARVPVNKVEPIFSDKVKWINVYDGRDPVSGLMKAFNAEVLAPEGVTPRHCPTLQGFGYAASSVLLLSHIRYLKTRGETKQQLPDVLADWLMTGTFTPPTIGQGRWYDTKTYWHRVNGSWIWWLVAFAVLAVLGTITFKWLWQLAVASWLKGPSWLLSLTDWLGGLNFGFQVLAFAGGCILTVLLVGLIGGMVFEDAKKPADPNPVSTAPPGRQPGPQVTG